MAHLKALKLTSAVPTHQGNDPVARAREKTIGMLAEQKQMVEARIAGQTFAPTHMVRRTNTERQRVEIEKPKRVCQGWFTDASGKVFFGSRR